jgi:serine-type D-Ala-D-Ala carboxypeptidase/endopeptidase (penicillin-binding protein 4)
MNEMRTIFCVLSLFFCTTIFGQDVTIQVQNGITNLEKDPQFKHAILSMYVVDSKTGKVVFDKNSEVGLAPASCQKVITSVSAFELLGKGYRYKTEVGYNGIIENSILNGDVVIVGYGDPTLGSWRYSTTSFSSFLNKLPSSLKQRGIKEITSLIVDDSKWSSQNIPNGWVWEDVGNYYGAGAGAFNWHENKYDIILQSGKYLGDNVRILKNSIPSIEFVNELRTAEKGSGDNAYFFFGSNKRVKHLRGTIEISEKPFTISGASENGFNLFEEEIISRGKIDNINLLGIKFTNGFNNFTGEAQPQNNFTKRTLIEKSLYTHYSPPLDSINYWFLKKSVNLYGEAFVKTIGYQKKGVGATDTGLSVIKYFWKQRGIDPSAINIIDGSGLSPANRVTTNALVTVMQFAKKQNWFSSFYNALPDMNGIKMKDGYISGVRSYTGYVKSKSGNDYTFAFIVNNFDGSPAKVREKIWKVLDVLK